MDVFNFGDILTDGFILNCYRISMILGPIGSFIKLLSYETKKIEFDWKHSPKIGQNHNNITRNPNPDHWSFKSKLLPNEKSAGNARIITRKLIKFARR